MSFPSLNQPLTVPYVSVPEFIATPTWLDLEDLVEDGDATQQTAEQYNALLRASAWADNYVQMQLSAHYRVENMQCRVDRYGRIWIHPEHKPIRSIAALSYGSLGNMTSITSFGSGSPTGAESWIEDSDGVIIALCGLSGAWAGSLQFGPVPTYPSQTYVQLEYVAGYGHGVLQNNTTIGAESLLVDTNMGFQTPMVSVAGNTYGASIARIWDPAAEEAISVSTLTGTDLIGLASPTLFNHQLGVNVSELPAEVKLAVTQYATALLLRQDVTDDLPFPGAPGPSARRSTNRGTAGGLINEAECNLRPYKRVR